MSKILFVDDDENLLAMVEAFFKTEKYTVETAKCVEDAEDILAVSKFDILVVDWMMPGKSGLQLVQQIRSQRDRTPIIMLTGQSAMDDKEAGLDGGADDYLTKPFAMRELSVRVRALLRRAAPEVSQVLIAGQINLDTKTRTCTVNGATISLLPKEYSLLEFLMRHPNETFSNDALIERVWKSDTEATEAAIRTCVMRLRKKLAEAGDAENRIQTVARVGYRLEP
ncbi:response regulator transcription factor [Candidatus Obscuribacterales bacterium]|nr:response regulator transcription factor [Candidatus Obscuribacterales bacterium]